jgi:AcrR family transcriptional regulator
MTGTPGRPLSAELSEQLVAVAVDILAEDGWSRLNSDRIAARARAGKAGIYRRWSSMPVLVREAVSRFDLVPVPGDTGSLRGDLLALLERWTQPLDRQERAAAAIVGAARFDDDLRAGLDTALGRPLTAAVTAIGQRALEREEVPDPARLLLLGSVLEAFWWQRFTAPVDGAMEPERVVRIVDEVLLPAAGVAAGQPEAAAAF